MRLKVRLGLHELQGFFERDGGMRTPPLPGVPTPHHIESGFREIAFHMVEARERRIALLPANAWKSRPVTRDEAVFAAPPFAENVDRIVEPGRTDRRQKPGLERVADEAGANNRNSGFFSVVRALTLTHLFSCLRIRATIGSFPPISLPVAKPAPYSHSMVPGGFEVTS
jgi:hypothetical protein